MDLDIAYLEKRLDSIISIDPQYGIKSFFIGMYNHVPLNPKNGTDADNYYLYVLAYNNYSKNNPDLLLDKKFIEAIDQLIQNNNGVSMYIAFEIINSQLLLEKQNLSSFNVDRNAILEQIKSISKYFCENKQELLNSKYGLGQLYPDGLYGVICDNSKILEENIGYNVFFK